jgi:hypothetical protein
MAVDSTAVKKSSAAKPIEVLNRRPVFHCRGRAPALGYCAKNRELVRLARNVDPQILYLRVP